MSGPTGPTDEQWSPDSAQQQTPDGESCTPLRYCRCGHENESDSRFCVSCGSPLPVENVDAPPSESSVPPESPPAKQTLSPRPAASASGGETASRSGRRLAVVLVAAAVGAALLLAAAIPVYMSVRNRAMSADQQAPSSVPGSGSSSGQQGSLPPGRPPPVTSQTPYSLAGAERGAGLDGVDSSKSGHDVIAVIVATNDKRLIDAAGASTGLGGVQLMHKTPGSSMTQLVGTAIAAKDIGTTKTDKGTSSKLKFYFAVPTNMRFVSDEFIFLPFEYGGWALDTMEYR